MNAGRNIMYTSNLEETLKRHNTIKKIKSKSTGSMVCRYWLESDSCKKGQNCEFLHELIESKIPECTYSVGGICTRKDCKFKHTKKEKIECHFFRNGYCKEGRDCKMEHIPRELCINYLLGFCPEGPNCKFFHLKSLISKEFDSLKYLTKEDYK